MWRICAITSAEGGLTEKRRDAENAEGRGEGLVFSRLELAVSDRPSSRETSTSVDLSPPAYECCCARRRAHSVSGRFRLQDTFRFSASSASLCLLDLPVCRAKTSDF